MRKGIMAMESMDEVVDVPEVDVTDFVEAPEASMIEMNDAAAEVADVDEGITEAVDTAETLDAMQDSMAEAVEEGGISEPAADAIRVAVEHMTSRLGFPRSVKVFPAMEGFSDKATRVQSTKIAMESIGENVKKIWAAIVAAFDRAVEWVKKFFAQLMDTSVRLVARADSLSKVATAKKSEKAPIDAKISAGGPLGGFAKQLHVGGVVSSGSEFTSAFVKYVKSAGDLSFAQFKLAEDGQAAMAALMTTVGDDAAFISAGQGMVATFAEAAVGQTSANKDMGGEGMEVKEEKLSFGDKSFFSVIVTDDSKAVTMAGKVKFTIGDTTGSKKAEVTTKDVTPLSPSEVISVTKVAKTHMEAYAGFKKAISAIEGAQATIKKEMANLVKEASKDAGSKASANSKNASAIARAYISAVTAGSSSLRSYDISVCKAALDYCGASLKLLPGAKKEEKAPAKA